jgi:hypothetical protein
MSEIEPNDTEPKKMVSRSVAIALGIICIVLIALIAYFTVTGISAQNSYNDLQNQNQQLQTWLDRNITSSYNSGYQAGVTSRGFDIVDPTYQQMLSFMKTDTVHNNVYNSTYVCWNFASDYINEAFKAKWRCGFVYIEFPVEAHAVVCFNTTDKGIVFVEPQFDTIVKVAIGLSYSRSNGFAPTTYNDSIVNYGIIW